MNLTKIVKVRKRLGLTQEELATKAGVTLRTIQRIENGEGIPRPYTIKAIAMALGLPFEEFQENDADPLAGVNDDEDKIHFLKILIVSCFSYLLIPFVHFLIPAYLLQSKRTMDRPKVRFARKLLRGQVYWVVSFIVAMLITVTWNLISKKHNASLPMLSYLTTLFVMYCANAVLIITAFLRLKKLEA